MKAALERRYPFPRTAEPLLREWTKFAAEVNVEHGEGRTRTGMDGLGDPAGPRQWRDNGGVGYKVFLAYFLPVDGKPVNHHLSVEFAGSRVLISGGNHRGAHIELSRDYTRETFSEDLRFVARFVGLLPGAEA